MCRIHWGLIVAALLTCTSASIAVDRTISPDLSKINDAKCWSAINVEISTAKEEGRTLARLSPKGGSKPPGSNVGLALVEGLEFSEGTLEIDLKGKGKTERTFLGVAFNVEDANTFEAVYFRPFNFMADSDTFRARAVQYVSWPGNTWEKLRMEKPGSFESAVKPIPDPSGWFHARVEVTKKKVSVWVDDAKEPCLIVERLSNRLKGKVGLWVDSNGGAFSNLKIVSSN
jgi:hypothetical protein